MKKQGRGTERKTAIKKESTAVKLIADRSIELNNISLTILNAGPAHLSSHHVTLAISQVSRAIFLNKQEPSYYINRAEGYLLANDYESCISNLKKAQLLLPPRKSMKSTFPDAMPGACWKGVITANENEEDRDLFYGRDKFEACASSSVWLNLKFRRIYFTFGQILLDQRRLYESLKYFKLARDFGMCTSSVYLRMVAIYIGLHKTDEALELLYNLIEKHPKNADLYILRAKLYSELGHVDLVSMDLNKVAILNPQHPEMRQLMEYVIWTSIKYKNKASAQILKGQFDVAVFFLNHALELDPTDWITLLKRGVIFSEMGHYESAIADLKGVLEMDDRDRERDAEVKSYVGSVYNKLGVDLFLNKNLDEAVNTFKKAIQFTSTEAIIFKNLADCYWFLDDDNNREKCLYRAYQLNPADDETREKLAELYFSRGERGVFAGHFANGLRELSKAIDLSPNANYIFERGRVNLLTEQLDAAREDLSIVLKMNPNHREASAMFDQLVSKS
ncbi:Tetratricopeptide repeat protein 16 [Rhizoclosmatium hyalinum]|nr:Tetratricopeptide repeat protein 16 [Rhizoclosmatium hyalinum]